MSEDRKVCSSGLHGKKARCSQSRLSGRNGLKEGQAQYEEGKSFASAGLNCLFISSFPASVVEPMMMTTLLTFPLEVK